MEEHNTSQILPQTSEKLVLQKSVQSRSQPRLRPIKSRGNKFRTKNRSKYKGVRLALKAHAVMSDVPPKLEAFKSRISNLKVSRLREVALQKSFQRIEHFIRQINNEQRRLQNKVPGSFGYTPATSPSLLNTLYHTQSYYNESDLIGNNQSFAPPTSINENDSPSPKNPMLLQGIRQEMNKTRVEAIKLQKQQILSEGLHKRNLKKKSTPDQEPRFYYQKTKINPPRIIIGRKPIDLKQEKSSQKVMDIRVKPLKKLPGSKVITPDLGSDALRPW